MEREITEYVAAFEQTVRTTIGLAETFTAADWDLLAWPPDAARPSR